MNSISKYSYVVNCGFKPDIIEISTQGCKFLLYENVPHVIEAGTGDNKVKATGGQWTFICHTTHCWLNNKNECCIAKKESTYLQTYPQINKICL